MILYITDRQHDRSALIRGFLPVYTVERFCLGSAEEPPIDEACKLVIVDIDTTDIVPTITKIATAHPKMDILAIGNRQYRNKSYYAGAVNFIDSSEDGLPGHLSSVVFAELRRHERDSLIVKYKSVTIDREDRKIFVNDKDTKLAGSLYDIALYLAQNTCINISSGELANAVLEDDTKTRNVYEYMKRLRDRLEAFGSDWDIQTIRGYGFRLDWTRPQRNSDFKSVFGWRNCAAPPEGDRVLF